MTTGGTRQWVLRYYYSNGNKFEGEYKNGQKEGYGVYYYSNGDKFEGKWKNNNKEGYGIYYYSSENRYEYEFYNKNKDNEDNEDNEHDLSSFGYQNKEDFISEKINNSIYKKMLSAFEYFYSIFIKRKIAILLIIILIFGLLIN